MKMKKIISALLMGAAAAGIATADLSIKASPKVSGHWFRYNTSDGKNLSASGSRDKTLFLLDGYANATKGDLTMTASGNIFTFTATLVPDLKSDIEAKTLTVQAKLGNFTLKTGFDNGGISTYGATISNGNDEGRFANAYKLGSPFSGTPLIMSNNQTAFGKDQKDYFVHGKYALGLGDVLTLNIAASVMSPHGWNESQKQATDGTSSNYYMKDGKFSTKTRGGKTLHLGNRSVGWGVFLNPVVKNIVGIEAFAKGVRLDDKDSDDGSAHGSYNYVLGGYVSLLVPLITKSAFGGSVWLCDSTLQEWSADLDFSFKFGKSTLAWDNKFGAMIDNVKKVDGTVTTRSKAATNVGYGTQYANNYLLYNALRLSIPLNDTLTVIGSIGQQSGFGDGDGQKGTTLYVYPQVQMSVTSAATLSAGAAVTLDRIGAKNFAKGSETDKMALLVNVPVVVKFSL